MYFWKMVFRFKAIIERTKGTFQVQPLRSQLLPNITLISQLFFKIKFTSQEIKIQITRIYKHIKAVIQRKTRKTCKLLTWSFQNSSFLKMFTQFIAYINLWINASKATFSIPFFETVNCSLFHLIFKL